MVLLREHWKPSKVVLHVGIPVQAWLPSHKTDDLLGVIVTGIPRSITSALL